tara:strand:+ start:2114 stop:2410 length:297 start_codon:yes stop_codon:yes gene_type:complete
MSKVLADTLQGRAAGNEAPNFPKGLTSAGIGTFSSDVRITGNINAGISTLTGKATVGSVTLQHSDIVAGVVTATSYKGDGADLTGLPAGFSWIEGNLF